MANNKKPFDKDKKSLKERAFERVDLRVELDRLDSLISELKAQYEMFFTGILPLAPDKLQQEVKMLFLKLKKSPFRSSAMNYRLNALESRHQTYTSYWRRVLREREDGVYCKDVFKANLRDKISLEEAHSQTAQGKAEKSLVDLFQTYKRALEESTGKQQNLNFDSFKTGIVNRAKELKTTQGAKKVKFTVIMKDGRVKVQAKIN